MRLAHLENWTVAPAGAATWLAVGNPLAPVDLVISTTRLIQIVEHEPADLIATAQAGVTLSDFNQTLARGRQWLPLDPPDDGRATIGGVVASGLSGPQSHSYGGPRNFVIGMKVVRADGKLVKAGGKVVKNVAGYDLCKLFTGSYGTLGLITEVTFKLRPLPQEICTTLVWGSVESLLDGARKLVSANLFPAAVELLSPDFAAEADFAKPGEALLMVRFAGSREAVEQQSLQAEELLRLCGRWDGPMPKDDFKLWEVVSKLPLGFSERCVWSAAVPPADVPGFLRLVDDNQGSITGMWQLGVAGGHIRGIEPATTDSDQTLKKLQRLRAAAEALRGLLLVENADADIKNKFDAWGSLGSRASLMKQIKQQLDPQNILSPGRFAL